MLVIQLIKLWQILFFIGLTCGLAYGTLRNGKKEINDKNITIIGSSNIDSTLIIKKSKNLLPNSLLDIQPKQLKKTLKENLPIKRISIKRILFPPHIEINILEMDPIAYATRKRSKGLENGMLDIDANWIPIEIIKSKIKDKNVLKVEGWMEIHRLSIRKIFDNKDKFPSPIKKIVFHHDGEIIIETNNLKEIQLGTNTNLLDQKIMALNYLSKNLPSQLKGKIKSVDLRNLSQPELQIAKP